MMQPYANGIKITYDQDAEAIIRGFTHLDSGIHYVLQTEGNDLLFIRPADKCARATSLEQYIGDYIETEVERNQTCGFDLTLPVRKGQIRQWIAEAIDAYEEGAR